MSSLIPVGLSELIEEATAEADRHVDAFIQVALKNVDISLDAWDYRLRGIRRDTRTSAIRKARVIAALNALNKAEIVRESKTSMSELKAYLDATHAKLSEGVALDHIVNSTEPGSVILRREMNRQLPIIRMPVEILSMIFEEYAAGPWDERSEDENWRYSYIYLPPAAHEKDGYKDVCTIGYVCSDWRTVSLKTGSLWSRLSLRWPRDVLCAFISRSGGSPLEVFSGSPRLRGSIDDGVFGDMTSLIMGRHQLIKKISLDLSMNKSSYSTERVDAALSRMWEYSFPKLKSLSLTSQHRFGWGEEEYPFIGSSLLSSAPNLHELSLERLQLSAMDGIAPLVHLTSLTMDQMETSHGDLQLPELVALLCRMPNLSMLKLKRLDFQTSASSAVDHVPRAELSQCKDLELQLSSQFPLKILLSAIYCPKVETLEIECPPVDDKLALSSFHALPQYISELVMQCRCLCLKPDSLERDLGAYYHMKEDANFSKDTPQYTFTERSYATQIQLGADLTQEIHPVIASVVKLPLDRLTVLYMAHLINHQTGHLIPSAGNWRSLFSALSSLKHLEIWHMKKMVTINLCKALGDALSCPELTTLTIDNKSFNLKEVKKCLSQRNISKVALETLNVKSLNPFPMRSIPCSYRVVECFTNCEEITDL
ncbi:hypothetical protein SISNIDRAFT_450264 [Sistotremastrum niveocremeum HHB9708]|uniref:Uncharacterized protein n=1 Tax=Sistotremastrum niveocremeum HHB9708 TaxID=1314777 RepID=A0A164Z1U9_9AGAM|nr:hypothetical protein SISNIDRAFT_450264 [Sistotremastrum niveocremeum HHB9708]